MSVAFIRVAGWLPTQGSPFTYIWPVIVSRPPLVPSPDDSDPDLLLSQRLSFQAFFTCAIPLMVVFELLHRTPFTRRMRTTLGAPDVSFLAEYYSLHPDGGFWVYEHRNRLVAALGLDVVRPREQLTSLIADEELPAKEKVRLAEQTRSEKQEEYEAEGESEATSSAVESAGRTTRSRKAAAAAAPAPVDKPASQLAKFNITSPFNPTTAAIRHLYVDIPYLPTSLLGDMIRQALSHAFRPESSIQEVLVEHAVGRPKYLPVFEQAGFKSTGEKGHAQGFLGLAGRNEWLKVDKQTWLALQEKN